MYEYISHARNAPWALALFQSHAGSDYSSLAEWMAAPAVAFSPREQVWRQRSDKDSVYLMYGYEYFVAHADVDRRCNDLTSLGELKFNHHETGYPTKWRVCLQRLGVVCISSAVNQLDLNQPHPTSTVVVVEDTKGCPSDWSVPLHFSGSKDGNTRVEVFAQRFLQHVLYWTARQVTNQWVKLIRGSLSHFMLFVSYLCRMISSLLTPGSGAKHLC